MKSKIRFDICFIFLLTFLFFNTINSQKNVNYRWDKMLDKYVFVNGRVNYKDWKKEQPDEFTTTITGPDGEVIDQSVDSASTAMRKKRAGTVANRGQAIRKIAGVS